MPKTKEKFVKSQIRNISFVTITFDLWMLRGSHDIFSVMVHWLSDELKLNSRHLELVQMYSTAGFQIASKLASLLKD